MYYDKDIQRAKSNVEEHIGSKVRVKFNSGKRKVRTKDGVLTNAYNSIFLVDLETENNTFRSTAYSYKDLLTENVKITLI